MRFACLLVALLLAPSLSRAQQPQSPDAPSGSAAFLFGYFPTEGAGERFEEGYRRHLDWHEEHGDRLPWYAWYVITGDRIGLFIDGTFGVGFADIDARPDPAGDRADFEQSAGPFARPDFRSVYRVRHDLSSVTPLENRQPSRMVQAIRYRVRPGGQAAFEAAVRAHHESIRGGSNPTAPGYTWYELVSGGEQPAYLLMIPLGSWADLGTAITDLGPFVTGRLENDGEAPPGAGASGIVDSILSETWVFRSDLTYLPGSR